ncbi:hypothetical protein C9374_011699 [Naegleria lovaniensis]|uniref:Uncharacterized protein n=1 Tax=Naegleria lovaniensis TaxID=51637 RepID=A0AA88GFU1_NAELO|nr:uncharacterized protein C9374_011699 [Naegleria lovaniensis]KAG2373814.1 hypothetical protein C9374_011699 [Naegleria lovaniensis]
MVDQYQNRVESFHDDAASHVVMNNNGNYTTASECNCPIMTISNFETMSPKQQQRYEYLVNQLMKNYGKFTCCGWHEWLQEHVEMMEPKNGHDESIFVRMKQIQRYMSVNFAMTPRSNSVSSNNENVASYTIVKRIGLIHFLKPQTLKKTKLDQFLNFLSSEEFGAKAITFPPLIVVYWYTKYQRESLILNCAQYKEADWKFTEIGLERNALLLKYPQKIEKKINNGDISQEELDEYYPKRINLTPMTIHELEIHGLCIHKASFQNNVVYHVQCGEEIYWSFVDDVFAANLCHFLISLFSIQYPRRRFPLFDYSLLATNQEINHLCRTIAVSDDDDIHAVMYDSSIAIAMTMNQ